jgi:hypothetical protein
MKKADIFILCGFPMRFERAYSQGNPIKTQPVAAVLVKTVENIKKQAAPVVPQRAVKKRQKKHEILARAPI